MTKKFADALRSFRKQKEWTQATAARFFGMSEGTYQNIEELRRLSDASVYKILGKLYKRAHEHPSTEKREQIIQTLYYS